MNLILRTDVLLPIYASILICVLAVAVTSIGAFWGLRRVRRYLRRDEWPPAGRRNYPEAVHLVFTSLAVLLLLGAVAWSRYSGNGKEQIVPDEGWTFPHVKLEEVLTAEATVKEILSHGEMMAWNTSRTSSLAPEQYWTTQGAYTVLDGDTVESRMDLDLYTAVSPALAEAIYRGSLVSHIHGSLYHRYRPGLDPLFDYQQEERPHPGLDRLSVCYDPDRPDIVYIGRRGDTVFILSCDGHLDGEKALALLADRLAA